MVHVCTCCCCITTGRDSWVGAVNPSNWPFQIVSGCFKLVPKKQVVALQGQCSAVMWAWEWSAGLLSVAYTQQTKGSS